MNVIPWIYTGGRFPRLLPIPGKEQTYGLCSQALLEYTRTCTHTNLCPIDQKGPTQQRGKPANTGHRKNTMDHHCQPFSRLVPSISSSLRSS